MRFFVDHWIQGAGCDTFTLIATATIQVSEWTCGNIWNIAQKVKNSKCSKNRRSIIKNNKLNKWFKNWLKAATTAEYNTSICLLPINNGLISIILTRSRHYFVNASEYPVAGYKRGLQKVRKKNPIYGFGFFFLVTFFNKITKTSRALLTGYFLLPLTFALLSLNCFRQR